jgi:hypothetical protein
MDRRKKVHTTVETFVAISIHVTMDVVAENFDASKHEHTSNSTRGSCAEAWD